MRLEALLQKLHAEPVDEVKNYPLDEAQHVVAFETAAALANLAQSISAHGITLTQECRPELFAAVATSLLKPHHPGWGKNLSKTKDLPAETMKRQTIEEVFAEPPPTEV